MDLSSLEYKQDAMPMTLMHPLTGEPITNDEGKPMRFFFFGVESSRYVECRYDINRKRLQEEEVEGEKKITLREIEAMSLELLINATFGWENIQLGGELPFSPENARKLFTNPKFNWIREQAATFLRNRENYLGN